uniref:ATPase, T2SS/T4P/T4SS family n=1 Tax=Pseudomonas aeruginosa TaxID=287 RepID=UPI0013CE132F
KDDSLQIPTFSMLGYHPEQERTLRRILQRPEGIITLSGPTGSGKSTTLNHYLKQALLQSDGELIIATAEDPVEQPIRVVTIRNGA